MSASVRHSVINEELEMFQDQRDSQINQVDLSDAEESPSRSPKKSE